MKAILRTFQNPYEFKTSSKSIDYLCYGDSYWQTLHELQC
jgi:hypothetical protein